MRDRPSTIVQKIAVVDMESAVLDAIHYPQVRKVVGERNMTNFVASSRTISVPPKNRAQWECVEIDHFRDSPFMIRRAKCFC